jgi:hypothetical protein
MTRSMFLGEEIEPNVTPMLDPDTELTRRIDTLTFKQVGSLQVECTGSRVTLRGWCKTYYTKQLATQAVLDLLPGSSVTNSIDVTR